MSKLGKFKNWIILFNLFFMCLSTSCDKTSNKKLDSGHFIFLFENLDYVDDLLSYLSDKQKEGIFVSLSSFINRKITVPSGEEVTDQGVSKFFNKFETFNRWPMTHIDSDIINYVFGNGENIQGMLNVSSIFYIGQVQLSTSFQSFLFLRQSTYNINIEFEALEMYIINIYANRITSISCIGSFVGNKEIAKLSKISVDSCGYYLHDFWESNPVVDPVTNMVMIGQKPFSSLPGQDSVSNYFYFIFDAKGRVVINKTLMVIDD